LPRLNAHQNPQANSPERILAGGRQDTAEFAIVSGYGLAKFGAPGLRKRRELHSAATVFTNG
jgi:hypothetical protein